VPALIPAHQLAVRARINNTTTPTTGKRLHDGFFHHAHTQPDHPAITGPDGTLTYHQLARQALHIAGWLTHHGTTPGDPIAITLPKGPHQIAAVLGTLAAGGTYVPINPQQPPARQHTIHTTAGITHTLDHHTITQALNHPHPLTQPTPTPDTTPAYIIFTSGSTGTPKGVELTHHAAQNTIDDINTRYHLTPHDNTIAVSNLDFDLSVYDIFGTLTAGATITTITDAHHRDPHTWAHLIHTHHVTIWNTVPTLLDMLLTAATPHQLHTLRLALVSGDWIPLDQHHRLTTKNPHTQHIALGGATEAAIWSNHHPITHIPDHWTSIPYGTPLNNQTYRVTDPHGNDRPDWVPGELHIGGTGLATGYKNQPDLTHHHFTHHHHQRWYRTGDQGRYWPDGTLEFLGRTDHQIKLNGHRIELGDIETHLTTHPHIHHTIATTTHHQLTAVAVTDRPDLDPQELRQYLAELLPPYLIPERIVLLDALPLTPNGKVDRAAVTRLAAANAVDDVDDPPRGATEKELAGIWSALLDRDTVGRRQSFFALGGNSLAATELVEELRRRYAVRLSLRELYAAPTIAGLAELLDDDRIAELEEGSL
jgi:amino acid adenylation domain-containing protein